MIVFLKGIRIKAIEWDETSAANQFASLGINKGQATLVIQLQVVVSSFFHRHPLVLIKLLQTNDQSVRRMLMLGTWFGIFIKLFVLNIKFPPIVAFFLLSVTGSQKKKIEKD